MASADKKDEAPNSAPLGAMGSLLGRLRADDGGSISKLKDDIRSISDMLKKLSELHDPPLTANYWMKHARELSYDIEAYLDDLVAQTEGNLNVSDAKKEDNPDDSDAKMEDFIHDSDDGTEYSVDDSDAKMEDSINDSNNEMKDSVDDSDGSMQNSICSSADEMEDCIDDPKAKMEDFIFGSVNKMSGFKIRAEGMIERYKRFSLDSVLNSPTATTTIVRPCPSRDVVLVGMDNQITKLISLLQPKDENDNHLKIVSILGDEGVGKSTLIQEIWRVSFKEQKIWPEPQTEVKIKRAFVRMGKKPDVRMILRSILSQVSLQEPAKDSGVTNLIQDIRKHLEHKRYFIIVDDVRSLSVWDVVGRAFPRCSFGSRIITTTSDKEVALACCSYVLEHNYVMEPLSVGDCKELFIRTVVGFRTVNLQLSKDVSVEIKRKCGALPLGIMWTGILVASQPETEEKLCQLETEQGLSKMEKEKNLHSDVKKFLDKNLRTESSPVEILNHVLKLCYNTLPHYLKTCLLYLSVYPENYFFLKEDLVKLWIAEGFICTSEDDKVEAAGRYFDVLVSLGLIQRMDIDCNKQHHLRVVVEDEGEEDPLIAFYIVHPTVFDFICCKSIEDNFITIIDHSQSTPEFKDKIRRLSLHFGSATYVTTPASIGLSQVRTLSFMGLSRCIPSLVEFRLVRVVILHLWADDEDKKFVLAEIDKLLLLRYLQARCNVSIELPGQIGCMKHLETLEINSVVTTLGPVFDQWFELLPSIDDSSSTSRFELLPPICIFSRLPMWIAQLRKLSILEIVVRELLTADIDMLADLPALTALSLYVRIPTAGNIVFRRGAFPALKYFRFKCGVLSLDFQEEAMPNLRRLMIGFNVRRREKYDNILAGIQHLLNLQEVVASIGATMGAEKTDRIAAESALKDAINKHPRPTKLNVKGVHRVEEDFRPPPFDPLSINEQEEVPVKRGPQTEDSTNQQPINLHKVPGKDTHEHASFGIPHTSDLQEDDNTSHQQKSAMTVADGLKLILDDWSGSLDVSSGITSRSEVHEIEVEKDEIVYKGEVKVEEYDLEKILDEQENHDLFCPNCKSGITRRVILKKRKGTGRQETRKVRPKRPQLVEPSAIVPSQTAETDSPEVFRCLLVGFTLFIPTGCSFNIFRIFERRDVNQQVQVQHSSASQETSENCGSWLLSCFQTVDSPKPSNAVSLEEPLLSDSQRTGDIASVENSTPSWHSHDTIGKAEQSEKPSLAGSQTTTATNEVKQSFSQFHASSTVVIGSTTTNIESVHVVNVEQYGAHQEQIPLSQPAGDTETDTSHLGHKEEFTQIEAGHVVTVQRNGASQERIPLSQPSGDTATDSKPIGHKQDILEDKTTPSDNSPFFSQPFSDPVPKVPIKVLPGEDNQTVEKPTSVIGQPVESEAPPHTVVAVPEAEIPVAASSAPRDEWDILKAIVYGGLVESVTSLSVVSAAAASGAKTLDIFILGIANLIGGLPVVYHNIADLRNTGDVAESSEQVGHYWLQLGRRSKYQLHMVIAILSYILFGLLPPVIYGLSFRTSDNRENKMLVVAAVSLFCIALLAIGKAHVKRPRTYFTTLLYYLSIGFSSSGLSYVAGVLITKLLANFGIIDQGGPSAPAPPGLSFPEAAAWASY